MWHGVCHQHQPAPTIPLLLPKDPLGQALSGTRSSVTATPPSPATPQLLRMVLAAKEAKPSKAAGERFAPLGPAQLRTPLAALFWSKEGSIAPRSHHQKSLMVKPQRAAASQPTSLAATPLPEPEPGHTARAGGNRERSQW